MAVLQGPGQPGFATGTRVSGLDRMAVVPPGAQERRWGLAVLSDVEQRHHLGDCGPVAHGADSCRDSIGLGAVELDGQLAAT